MKGPLAPEKNSVMDLSAAAATGHLRPADALVAAFAAQGVSARHIEVLRYTNPGRWHGGRVLVIVNPIPGEQERNSDHFLEEGVEIRCNNFSALAYQINTLLADQGRSQRCSRL